MLIGDEHVGKSSLIQRYINDAFTNEYQTTLGADFEEKLFREEDLEFLDDEESLQIYLWDMGGQEIFESMTVLYMEGSSGVIIAFDLNATLTFDNVSKWEKYVQQVCPDAIVYLVGMKSDLKQKVEDAKIQKYADKRGYTYVKTSSKENLNVDDVFLKISNQIVQRIKEDEKSFD